MTGGTAGGQAEPIASDLRQRVLWGMLLAAIALLATFAGGVPFAIGVAAMVAVVAREWAGMTVETSVRPAIAIALPAVAATLLAAWAGPGAALGIAVAGALVVGIALRRLWAAAAAGVLYASALGIGLVLVRIGDERGLVATMFVLFAVWGADTGAFFVGRAVGGPKLWPRVSPKKTWSGFVGGTGIGALSALALAAAAGIAVTAVLAAVALGLSLLAAAGDLFESAVKRRFHTKDAGALIPGHGGMMDRVDGLVFASAAAAVIGWLHAGWPGLGRGLLQW